MAKHVFHTIEFYKQGRFFLWAVPLANLVILLAPGLLLGLLTWIRPGLVPLRAAVWLLATLAIWAPLLNMPIAGWTGLVLAAGLGRLLSRGVANFVTRAPGWLRAARPG